MKPHGFVTHVARNRRVAIELGLLYLVALQILGCFAISPFLVIFDPEHLIINDPAGYALRYSLPVFLFSALYLAYHYRRHAEMVRRRLKVQPITSREEPRFVHIAEAQCIAQGIRLPRFGVIEAAELNALTVGEGPSRGLIVVTRGLLNALDDDELSAVIAHEAAHIRHGDTRLLALNHVFHRTTISLSLEHPFRFDHWFAFVIVAIIPLLLPVFLIGNLATRLAMALTYKARQTLQVRRDFVADAAAVRMTHDPAALVSAMRKTAGKGEFEGAARVAGLLFDARPNSEGYRTVPVEVRIGAIEQFSGDLVDPSRSRRDTRPPRLKMVAPRPRAQAAEAWRNYDRSGRPMARPPRADTPVMKMYFSDRELFHEWVDAVHAYWEWRPGDGRNWLGLKPGMLIPFAATIVFIGVFYWPSDGNWRTMAATFDPAKIVEAGRKYGIGAQPVCEGPSYPDGKCPD